MTTQQVAALGIVERTSTFATNLTSNAGRTENLRIAARTVNNTIVLPGETFSLNGVLGERTPEKGYNSAPAINGGRLVMDYGGGVSQMATTIFNNVFFTGLKDVYHKPHSFYISRYPEGREATVNWDTVDLKWTNDSPYGVLIQAWVDDQVHVSFWSTKVWDIESVTGPRTNFRTPQTVYDESDGCVAQDANGGFDVQVTRIFKKAGKEVRRETFSTTYIAEDRVVCGPDPAKTAPTTPGPGGDGAGTT
jgi:vancomycin resistance protein YoaR